MIQIAFIDTDRGWMCPNTLIHKLLQIVVVTTDSGCTDTSDVVILTQIAQSLCVIDIDSCYDTDSAWTQFQLMIWTILMDNFNGRFGFNELVHREGRRSVGCMCLSLYSSWSAAVALYTCALPTICLAYLLNWKLRNSISNKVTHKPILTHIAWGEISGILDTGSGFLTHIAFLWPRWRLDGQPL